MRLSLFLALRFLTRQRSSFSAFIIRLAAGATALSVAVMLVAAAVVTGFQTAIEAKLYAFWGHVQVTPYTASPSELLGADPIHWDAALARRMRAKSAAVQVAPYALRPAILRASGTLEGIQLKGIGPDFKTPPEMAVRGGLSFADTAYSKDILLSQATAARLRLKPGDAVQLYFLQAGGGLPRIRKLRLAGTYHTGLDEVDKAFAVCDIRLVQRLAGWGADEITGYQVDLPDARTAAAVSDRFYNQLLEPPLRSYTLAERYPQIFDWLRLQATNVRVLLGIMAVIAIINLAAALLILVVDRARTIGLLQALGMSQGNLVRLFVLLAGGIGVVGTVVGTALALGLCALQQATGLLTLPEETYYMHTVPVTPIWWHVVLIDATTVVLCLACMTLPALYIRRIAPARVLQFR